MGIFSEDRANELRNLFFETAQELLQALNEQGLELEKSPGDQEIVRNIRRTVHTLKGDAAACGYRELSESAHAMEDVLTPEVAQRAGSSLPELILSAADTFDAMLTAYRGDMRPPSGDTLREFIQRVAAGKNQEEAPFHPKFDWTEYEQLVIRKNAVRGQSVYNVALVIDPQCPMRAAALQLIRNVMQEVGSVLVSRPEDATAEIPEIVEAAVGSHHPLEWIQKKCKVPGVVSRIHVELCAPPQDEPAPLPQTETVAAAQPEPEFELVLDDLQPAQSSQAEAEPEKVEVSEQSSPAVQPVASVNGTHATLHAPAMAAPHTEAGKNAAKKAEKAAQTSTTDTVIRVDAERIDAVLDLVGELIIAKSMLQQSLGEVTRRFGRDPLRNQLADAVAFQAQTLNKLQRSVMKIRMVPVEQMFRRLPRVVRDIAKQLGREVNIVIEGEDTDLDKSILDALAEPMMHMVRNAVDHGIEPPDVREAKGKPREGTIRLNAYHQGNQVIIEVSDDGAGIDKNVVVAKAIRKGFISAEEAGTLSDSDALSFIFQSGLSTRDAATEFSGRGVGMDVVKAVMERLKGSISVSSSPGVGTTMRLRVPLTLAIIKALLFRTGDRLYAVPLNSVLEIVRAHESEVHVVERREVMQLRDEVVPLTRLRSILAPEAAPARSSKLFIVVVSIGDRKCGLVVDRTMGEQELVIKALDDHLLTTELVSGASILGDGKVVLILNLHAIVGRSSAATRDLGRVEVTA
ncbi:MAG TPA: chemotaxis protein CheA [Candidatus Acidoferrales bacterium]|nr:chemotaxis protein CheA [Candidatus Acidoferrales bacterium]